MKFIKPPIGQMLVPPAPLADPFVGRFCSCLSGKVGIVQGWKLVYDTRPNADPKMFRRLWYGCNYLTGRDWQSFDPKPLGTAALQKLTWVWGAIDLKTGMPTYQTMKDCGMMEP